MALMLGLDIGSTSIKANIYDLKGNLISGGSRPTVLSHPDKEHPSWAIWHPDDIWNAVQFLLESRYITGMNLCVDGGSSLL